MDYRNRPSKRNMERAFYSNTAKYMTNVNPLIVAGPAIEDHISLALDTVATNGDMTIVELDSAIHKDQISIGRTIAGTERTTYKNSCITKAGTSRFVDGDLTATIFNHGPIIRDIMMLQEATYPNEYKSIIGTVSQRNDGITKNVRVAFIQGLISKIIGEDCEISEFHKRSDNGNEAFLTSSHTRLANLHIISYNEKGGPMLTFNIIWR